jgi:hypothetical protein
MLNPANALTHANHLLFALPADDLQIVAAWIFLRTEYKAGRA